jgi:uncharacterized protein
MSANENKRIMQNIFGELEKGNVQALTERLADDAKWHVTGTTKFSKIYASKNSILNELAASLFSMLEGKYTNTAERFIAEDDYVVVECQGNSMTKAGVPYNNKYCFVFRLEDGEIKQVTEYMDTQLVVTALGG